MGLEQFESEGPRTYKKGGKRDPDGYNKDGSIPEYCVHYLKGSDIDLEFVPDKYERHEVVIRKELYAISMPNEPPYYVCPTCRSVSSDFNVIPKADSIDMPDEDWVDEYKDASINSSKQVKSDDARWEFETMDKDLEEPQEDDDEGLSSGLESFLKS